MFARYKVDWYFDGKNVTNYGYVQAYSFAEAVQKVEADYDDIEAVKVRWIGEGNNCLDDDVIAEALEVEDGENGAGHQIFEAIKEGIKEAIEYERLENNSKT